MYCDICEKRVHRYVMVNAREPWPRRRSWGWYEGHLACINKARRKRRRPEKTGVIRWCYAV